MIWSSSGMGVLAPTELAQAPLAHRAEDELAPVAEVFARDVIPRDAFFWRTWGDSYRPVTDLEASRPWKPVLDHLLGRRVISYKPVQRALVVDVDFHDDVPEGEEASWERKVEAARALGEVLDDLGVPQVAFDSPRGVHVWIRCLSEPNPKVLGGLGVLAESALSALDGASFELRPDGGRGIKLPLGYVGGRGRGSILGLDEETLIAWLVDPPRPTEDQLRAVEELAPVGSGPQKRASAPAVTAAEPVLPEPVLPGIPIRGFERWPRCKQRKYVAGVEREGERHACWHMAVSEAVLHADLSEGELVEIQLAMPLNDLSNSTEAELLADARGNAKNVLKRMAAGEPVLTGCPRAGPAGELAGVFAHHCTDESAATCPLLAQVDPMRTPYRTILDSSLWRGRQGGGKGLGPHARFVFEYAVRRARGQAGALLPLTARYVEAKLSFVPMKSAHAALKSLCAAGLLRPVGNLHYELAPPRDEAAVRELERQHGTLQFYEKAVKRHRENWQQRKGEPGSGTTETSGTLGSGGGAAPFSACPTRVSGTLEAPSATVPPSSPLPDPKGPGVLQPLRAEVEM